MSPPNPMSQEEAGERAVFLATRDRYAVRGGLVTVPEELTVVKESGRGILLVDPKGKNTDNEVLLAGVRKRGVIEAVWSFTQNVFTTCAVQTNSSKDEL